MVRIKNQNLIIRYRFNVVLNVINYVKKAKRVFSVSAALLCEQFADVRQSIVNSYKIIKINDTFKLFFFWFPGARTLGPPPRKYAIVYILYYTSPKGRNIRFLGSLAVLNLIESFARRIGGKRRGTQRTNGCIA